MHFIYKISPGKTLYLVMTFSTIYTYLMLGHGKILQNYKF